MSYDRDTIVGVAEAAMSDETWPLGDSIECYEQVKAHALPGTDTELAASVWILYCAVDPPHAWLPVILAAAENMLAAEREYAQQPTQARSLEPPAEGDLPW